jgi:hypothetical protein
MSTWPTAHSGLLKICTRPLEIYVIFANGAVSEMRSLLRYLLTSTAVNYVEFRDMLKPVEMANGQMTRSDIFKHLRKMQKLRFTVKHRGKEQGMLNL